MQKEKRSEMTGKVSGQPCNGFCYDCTSSLVDQRIHMQLDVSVIPFMIPCYPKIVFVVHIHTWKLEFSVVSPQFLTCFPFLFFMFSKFFYSVFPLPVNITPHRKPFSPFPSPNYFCSHGASLCLIFSFIRDIIFFPFVSHRTFPYNYECLSEIYNCSLKNELYHLSRWAM